MKLLCYWLSGFILQIGKCSERLGLGSAKSFFVKGQGENISGLMIHKVCFDFLPWLLQRESTIDSVLTSEQGCVPAELYFLFAKTGSGPDLAFGPWFAYSGLG